MRGKATLLLLTFLALMLAGCSAKGDGNNDDEFEDVFEDPPEVDEGKGLVRGIVLDPALKPVEGALVEITQTQDSVETTATGAFLFPDLEPGLYFVKVSKPGWTQAQQSVDVVADVAEPEIRKILIEKLPGAEPRALTQKFQGFISCSIGTPATFHNCNDVTMEEQKSRIYVDFEGRPSEIQTELVWDSTQAAGDWLYVIHAICACDGSLPGPDSPLRYNEVPDATSPYIVRAGQEFLTANDAGGANAQLAFDASASGPEPQTTNGSGAALNQDFDLYVTIFYNLVPGEGWTFIEDGEYPVPE